MKTRPLGAELLHADGRTDRHDEANSRFSQFCEKRLTIRKVKWSLYRPGVAQRVGRGIALLFHDRGTRTGWVVSSTHRPHFTPGKDPVPVLQEGGWAPGPVWKGGKSRPYRDSIPDLPARSQSLYRLSYPAHCLTSIRTTGKLQVSQTTASSLTEINTIYFSNAVSRWTCPKQGHYGVRQCQSQAPLFRKPWTEFTNITRRLKHHTQYHRCKGKSEVIPMCATKAHGEVMI